MSFLITKDKGEIVSKGGGIIRAIQVDEVGTGISGSDIDFGYIQDSTFKDTTPISDVFDETKEAVTQEVGNREIVLTWTMMQSGTGSLDLAKTVRDKYYRLYKYNGNVDGYNTEMFFGIGKITPSVDIKWPESRIPMEYKCSKNSGSISIGTAELGTVNSYWSSSFSIADGEFYAIKRKSA
jgi:hypothetical protein